MKTVMVDLRQSNNLADFVQARRAFLPSWRGRSDRLISALLTLVLSLAAFFCFAPLAAKAPPAPPPAPMMAEVLTDKLPPPPKMVLTRHFLKVPKPEMPPPVFSIPTNAPLGQYAAPATTRDPAYIASIAQHVRSFFQPASDPHQGVVTVHFVIDRTGKLLFLGVAKSSGVAALDDAAIAQLHRAEPLPPMPDQVDGDILYSTLAICFKAGGAC